MEKGKKKVTKFSNATEEQRKKYARRKRGAEKSLAESFANEELTIEEVGLLKDGTAILILTTESDESLTVELYNFYPLPIFNGEKEELKTMTAEKRAELTPEFEGILSEYEDTHTKLFEFGEHFETYIGQKVKLKVVECENVLRYYNGEYYTKSKDFYLVLNKTRQKI